MRYKLSQSEWPWHWPYKVTKVRICNHTIGLPIYSFLLMFNSNIWPILAHLQHINIQHLNDLDFYLSRSLKVKCDCGIWLPIYGFLLVLIVTYGPNQLLVRYKPSKSEWSWHWPFKVTQGQTWSCHWTPCIYAFLLMFNSNLWPYSVPLQDIRLQNLSDLEFDLSMSLKVKCHDIIGIAIHGFLLIYSPLSSLIATQNVYSYLFIIKPKLW